MAMPNVFQWSGNTGEIQTPDQVARQRRLADALMGPKPLATNAWEGLTQIGNALSGTAVQGRADEAEKAARAQASQAFSSLADGSGSNAEIIAALSNPWVASDPTQSTIAQALLQQNMKQSDPAYALDLDLKRAQLAAASRPEAQPLMSVGKGSTLYDPNLGQWVAPPTSAAGGIEFAPDVEGESKLRTEYGNTNTVKDFGLQTQAYQRVLDSARDPSPAGDLALIFNYMKVLDPGSTVREGEFATAQNSGSVPEQIMAQYNKVMSGERLVPEIRQDFVQRAGQLYEGAAGLQQGTNDRYSGLAQQYGYDPGRIVAPIPQIGVMDPNFNVQEYLTPQGTLDPSKPLPVTNDAEYEAIPSGATFQAPDGTIRIKP